MNMSEDLLDCIQKLRGVLSQYIGLLDAHIALFVDHESIKELREQTIDLPKSLNLIMPALFQALGSSSNTLVMLSENPGLQTRDCYSISRSIVELSVNICFLIVEGETSANRAIQHARQKSYRDLERESKIGNTIIKEVFSGRPYISKTEKLQSDIDEFTSRTGREKGWTDLSIDKRIERVGDKMGASVLNALHFSRFMVYRHSSEILHGSLFGVLYFYGLTSPKSRSLSQSDFLEHIGQQHMLILFSAILAFEAVIESFDKEYGFNWSVEKSKELMLSLGKIPYFS
jgi:hypothetical protein